MYNSGDAAEQVVRMSLEGAEVALKITGAAAKNLAAALYTVLKDQKKTKGKARIETMLREKRPLKVYTIKKEDCPEFARQAKGYGILYAPIPVRKEDDTIDILVFQDDAARANRIVEKFKLTVVDTASIKEDIEKSREERGGEPAAPEKMCIRDRVNTVSCVDGIKYYRSEKDYFAMQRESDRLCREYGLSVIENPQRGKSKHYGEWRAEQEGRPTYLSLIKADVDAAIRQSMTERQFFYHLRQMGYEVKVGKDITVRPYDRPHGRKLARNFGEAYSLENIRRRILAQSRPQREQKPEPKQCRLHGDLKQAKKATGFRALYFHYCYLLGVFPKKQNRQTGHVPLSLIHI